MGVIWNVSSSCSCSLTYISGEGDGTSLQYSCLENPMDGGAWWAAFHGVAKSRTRLSDFTFPFHFHALEKEIATHSSVPAWRIPGTGEPGGLPSMGSHKVGHDWSDLAAVAAAYSPWGHKESDMTEQLSLHFAHADCSDAVEKENLLMLTCKRDTPRNNDPE